MTGLRVVLAEDSGILRDGLTYLLTDRGHLVLAAVADPEALRAAVDEHRPDIAVIDIRMPPTYTDEGLRAALAVRAAHPGTPVLLFSQYVETRYAAQLLAGGAGGVGYLLKDRVAEVGEFVDALTRVAAGATVLDPEVVTQLLGAARGGEDLARLSERERTVLALMAQGRSNVAIAATLFLSVGAVEKHITSIFGKLGLPPSESDHRRVIAVLRHLQSG